MSFEFWQTDFNGPNKNIIVYINENLAAVCNGGSSNSYHTEHCGYFDKLSLYPFILDSNPNHIRIQSLASHAVGNNNNFSHYGHILDIKYSIYCLSINDSTIIIDDFQTTNTTDDDELFSVSFNWNFYQVWIDAVEDADASTIGILLLLTFIIIFVCCAQTTSMYCNFKDFKV